ncbi:hypothetical protein F4805DRAFT_458487 [Annulohypoxylon moriforme]|nr:hypothetical protein F4805DRAFT_458487 [Annulohypoxylon moriforme]
MSSSSVDEKQPQRQPTVAQESEQSDASDHMSETSRPPRTRRRNRRRPGSVQPLQPQEDQQMLQQRQQQQMMQQQQQQQQMVQQQDQGGGGKSDTLRLRLDLNLEVEVTLKARIHGDLTLALFRGEDITNVTTLNDEARFLATKNGLENDGMDVLQDLRRNSGKACILLVNLVFSVGI